MSGKGGATDLVRPRSVSERLADLPASTAQAPDGGRQTGGGMGASGRTLSRPPTVACASRRFVCVRFLRLESKETLTPTQHIRSSNETYTRR